MASSEDYCENCKHHISWHKSLQFVRQVGETAYYDYTNSDIGMCYFDKCDCKMFEKSSIIVKESKLENV